MTKFLNMFLLSIALTCLIPDCVHAQEDQGDEGCGEAFRVEYQRWMRRERAEQRKLKAEQKKAERQAKLDSAKCRGQYCNAEAAK